MRRPHGLISGITSVALLAALPSLALSAQAAQAQVPAGLSEQSAVARAMASGKPVEVASELTEYSKTTANPDGTLTLVQSTTPQRVKRADGSWDAVDPTLERRSDGTVGPKASVVGLSFSDGGDGGDLIRLSSAKGAMVLGWPGKLPEPVLDGATATYPEVFKGVDLQLTATTEGYREVLVVKSAQAAANPALEQVSLSVSGEGLQVLPSAGAVCVPSTRMATLSSGARPE